MFFKKELCITRDMKYYGELTERLAQNGIKYSFKINSPFHTGRYHGVPLIKSEAVYEYRIMVARKDYDLAKNLL